MIVSFLLCHTEVVLWRLVHVLSLRELVQGRRIFILQSKGLWNVGNPGRNPLLSVNQIVQRFDQLHRQRNRNEAEKYFGNIITVVEGDINSRLFHGIY